MLLMCASMDLENLVVRNIFKIRTHENVHQLLQAKIPP